MNPKNQFGKSYDRYIGSKKNRQRKHAFSHNKFYALGILMGILIIGPATAYAILNNRIIQDITFSQVSSINSPVSKITVTEEMIDREMQRIWGSYYKQVRNNPILRTSAKENLIVYDNLMSIANDLVHVSKSIKNANPHIGQKIVDGNLSQNPINISSITSLNSNGSNTGSGSKITVTEEMIDREMQKIWGSYYNVAKNNLALRNIAKKLILERDVLTNTAMLYRISVSQNDINTARINLLGNSNIAASTNNTEINTTIKETLIKAAIAKRVVNSKTIDIASIFKTQNSNFEAQKNRAKDSLEKIRILLLSGKSMKEAYLEAKKNSAFDTGITISQNVYVTKDSGWGKDFTDKIFSTPKGKITQVTGETDSFMIAIIIDENTTKYNSYGEWLASQIK